MKTYSLRGVVWGSEEFYKIVNSAKDKKCDDSTVVKFMDIVEEIDYKYQDMPEHYQRQIKGLLLNLNYIIRDLEVINQ